MSELKPCPRETEVLDIIESLLDVADMKCTGPLYADDPPRNGLCRIPEEDAAILRQYITDRRAQPANEPLCNENENFIQTKFGYCFYALGPCPLVYNLYVHPQYRRGGHSRTLLKLAINEIRKSGYKGTIGIQAEPREDSIGLVDLTRYYKSMGLTVCEARPPERSKKG